jgi:hypothetical protein
MLVGTGKPLEVSQVDACMSMQQMFDWVGTRLAGREEKDFLVRGSQPENYSRGRNFRQVSQENAEEKTRSAPPSRSNSQSAPSRGRVTSAKRGSPSGAVENPSPEPETKEEKKASKGGAEKGGNPAWADRGKGDKGGKGKGDSFGWKGGRGRDNWSQGNPWFEGPPLQWSQPPPVYQAWNTMNFKGGDWQKGGEKGKGKGKGFSPKGGIQKGSA